MKKIERIVYEKGDHVEITKGYHRGMVGTVVSHDYDTDDYDTDVYITLANGSQDSDDDEWGYDKDGVGFDISAVKYITKAQYEAGLKRNNILRVDGLVEAIQYKGGQFLIGDNAVSAAEAKKLADFIKTHTKPKAKKK